MTRQSTAPVLRLTARTSSGLGARTPPITWRPGSSSRRSGHPSSIVVSNAPTSSSIGVASIACADAKPSIRAAASLA